METIHHLTPPEIRVFGSLMEKSKTTPDYYPMTLNSLTAACNQKTSRYPVVDYDEQTVMLALDNLKKRSLVATSTGSGSRVTKYKHNFGTVYPVSDGAMAVMCLLFLRGAQTPGELNTNSGRMHEFSSLESVLQVLNELRELEPPFVREQLRRPGQKEAGFIHLFGNEEEQEVVQVSQTIKQSPVNLEERVAELEAEVAALKEQVNALISKAGSGQGSLSPP